MNEQERTQARESRMDARWTPPFILLPSACTSQAKTASDGSAILIIQRPAVLEPGLLGPLAEDGQKLMILIS